MDRSLGVNKCFRRYVKRIIVGMVLPAFLLCTYFKNPVLATGSKNWTEERKEIIEEQSEAAKQEQELIAEILKLRLRAETLKRELQDLEQQITDQNLHISQITTEIDGLKAKINTLRADLGKWVRYYYFTGSYAYLQVLFQAESFADFITRVELIGRLIQYNQKKIAEITDLEQKLSKTEIELQQQKALAETAYREKSKKSEMLAALMVERGAALTKARGVSQALYEQLLSLEQKWNTVFPNIDLLLRSFATLPWSSVAPDKISFNWLKGQIVVDVSAKNITSYFRKIDPKWLPLTVIIGDGNLAISYVEQENSTILLQGELILENNKVGFVPASLSIDGKPLQQDILQLLTREYDLSLDITNLQQGYILEKINLTPGLMRLVLGNRGQ
jgi:peptidoglycan hydrolase CwlO-like protein